MSWNEDPPTEPSRILVERKLRELVEQGYFDNLPGSDKPLDLSDEDNPFIPSDLRLAYRILRNAGMSLPWIELGNEVESDLAQIRRLIVTHERQVRSRIDRLRLAAPSARERQLAALRAEHAAFLARLEKSSVMLNRRIDSYNIGVPVARIQKPRFDYQAEVARLQSVVDSCLAEGI